MMEKWLGKVEYGDSSSTAPHICGESSILLLFQGPAQDLP